jgi:chromatin remodeling complex protein RSC6
MAPKSVSKKSESAPVATPVEAPKATKAASTKKDKKVEPVVEAAPVAEAPKAVKAPKQPKAPKAEATTEAAPATSESEKKERRVPTKESLHTDFEALLTKISGEVERLRAAKPKAKGVKFLKTINKDIKQLHSDVNRVNKFKKNGERKASTSSGFLKPVNISSELAKFTGWDVSKAYSRTAVTKFICNYIKTKKLYEESDKRNILCDASLKSLLKYDPANPPKDEEGKPQPLTYFRLQQYLKGHFKAIPAVEVEEDLE